MQIHVERLPQETWIQVEGRLDPAGAEELERRLAAISGRSSPNLVFDLEELEGLSCEGLVCLLRAAEEAVRDGGETLFVRPPAHVAEILEIAGATPIAPTPGDEAVAA